MINAVLQSQHQEQKCDVLPPAELIVACCRAMPARPSVQTGYFNDQAGSFVIVSKNSSGKLLVSQSFKSINLQLRQTIVTRIAGHRPHKAVGIKFDIISAC